MNKFSLFSIHKHKFAHKPFWKHCLCFSLMFALLFAGSTHTALAYSTNMEASVVVGQPNFTDRSANQGGSAGPNTVRYPSAIETYGKKMLVSDYSNNRVLIFNSLPSSNNSSASVVIGQANFTDRSANQGGSAGPNTLSGAGPMYIYENKLLVSDYNNNRVLIFNSLPTSNNASADVVIGQPNMTTVTSGTTASKFNRPWGIYVDESTGKLIIAESGNHRVLIYNSIPTSNGTPADIVLGQTDFTSSSQGTTATTLKKPTAVLVVNSKLLVSDSNNNRILIWNNIPSSNATSANVVIGQTNLTSGSADQASTVGANTLHYPVGLSFDGTRLFVSDALNNRILIFNSIPTSNNATADLVIGQPNFISDSANQGGIPSAATLRDVEDASVHGNKLLVSDSDNNRVLIFDNLVKKPGISLNTSPEGRSNNQVRLRGVSRVDSPYTVQTVQYAINGGGFSTATAVNGRFDEMEEHFYFDFDPRNNHYYKDGYTVRVKSTNNNTDVTDNVFYFSPFSLNGPANNSFTTNEFPTFEFIVNKGRFQDLKDNLSKFQVLLNKGNTGWYTYIDDIPVSYDSVKNSHGNQQQPSNGVPGNGTYENNRIWVNYSNENSSIKVFSKSVDSTGNSTDKYVESGGKRLSAGSYRWKVIAVDKSGHIQETESRYLRINTSQTFVDSTFFPLSVISISGIGNAILSTIHPDEVKTEYTTISRNPTFYGIANVNSKVTLELTDNLCQNTSGTDCVKAYETITNAESRFGINVPLQSLVPGRSYNTRLFVQHGSDYNELPSFDLRVR